MIRTAEQDRRVRSASRERKSDYNKNMMIRVSLPDHATNEQDGKELRVETRGFPRQEYWSGCHFLLQGIFPTQGSNPCLLHCRWLLYCWATRVAFPVFWCKKKNSFFFKAPCFYPPPYPQCSIWDEFDLPSLFLLALVCLLPIFKNSADVSFLLVVTSSVLCALKGFVWLFKSVCGYFSE